MNKYTISAIVIALLVGSFSVGWFLSPKGEKLGTQYTRNASNWSYTDGSDLYQNVQATTERMASGTQYQMLQANSAGVMERVDTDSLVLSLTSPTIATPNFTQKITAVTTEVTTTTLTTAMSGQTFVFSTTTIFVLPATSTAAGVWYKFVVGGAITSNVTVRTSDLGNNIEGTLIVAGAVVDCDAEDTITFVADGENIGDYFEIYSNGTYWFLGSSGALTSSKLTCTAS